MYDQNRPFRIPFGSMARDIITGFTGRVICANRHITGCDQYLLKPSIDQDGKERDGSFFDDDRLEVLADEGIIKMPGHEKPQPVGGPARMSEGTARSRS